MGESKNLTTESTPLSLEELTNVSKVIRSEIHVQKTVFLRNLSVIRSLVKNYITLEYAFRNLFRNSHVTIRTADKKPSPIAVQTKYDEFADAKRNEVLAQISNITSLYQQVYDTYQEAVDTHKIEVTKEYTQPQNVSLRIEVPEMHRVIVLFEIIDDVHVLAENLYLAGQITLTDKKQLTTDSSKKMANLARNASITSNLCQRKVTELVNLISESESKSTSEENG